MSTVGYELCTIADERYLPGALVLYRSLKAVCREFRLRVFATDERAAQLLRRMALPGLAVVDLDDLEAHDPELARVRPARPHKEYCWTAKPSACLYALEREPELETITLLDADLVFFHDPAPVFEELAGDSVLIVPHRYVSEWRHWEAIFGIYNTQLVSFRRTEEGLTALRWWRERCLEWCHDRTEDGRYGDQRYLDDWPERFRGVHVLEHPGAGVAPWNSRRYTIERRDGALLVDGQPLIFYHCPSLELVRGLTLPRRLGLFSRSYRLTRARAPLVWKTTYPLSKRERELVWHPYVRRLAAASEEIRRLDPRFRGGFVDVRPRDATYDSLRRALPGPLRAAVSRVRPRARAQSQGEPR